MTIAAKISPPNSLLIISDSDIGEIPQSMDRPVVATPSCIVVGTLAFCDGETSVALSDGRDDGDAIAGLRRVFAGLLATPTKEVHIYTVELRLVEKLAVAGAQTMVEIWANDDSEPDRLCVRCPLPRPQVGQSTIAIALHLSRSPSRSDGRS